MPTIVEKRSGETPGVFLRKLAFDIPYQVHKASAMKQHKKPNKRSPFEALTLLTSPCSPPYNRNIPINIEHAGISIILKGKSLFSRLPAKLITIGNVPIINVVIVAPAYWIPNTRKKK